MTILTGFHAIEEYIRAVSNSKTVTLFFSKPGPRVKKILSFASDLNIETQEVSANILDEKTAHLSEQARDHRGLVLQINKDESTNNEISLDFFLANNKAEKSIIVVLDSVTDPHNVGAIFRSCDQFGANLVILPSNGSAKNSDIISRSSAGAYTWVPFSIVNNLVRAVTKLKESGFWVYGADARGESLSTVNFPSKTAIIMGSEGNGISRLLKENCDSMLSIPTKGKVDSLNVSVAAGIFLYEISKSIN